MSIIKPEIEGYTIVFVGSFNPQIFQPAWFAAQNLLKKDEADHAKIEFLNRDLVIFSTDWLRFEVVQDRVVIGTTQNQAFEWIRDLALGTFRILHHTPLDKLGINRDTHYKIESTEKWHAIGDRLAPKDIWNTCIKKPGMASLTIRGERPDDYKGALTVRVEPSIRIQPGVYITVNDHYELESPQTSHGAAPILDILDATWASSLARSLSIAERIASLA